MENQIRFNKSLQAQIHILKKKIDFGGIDERMQLEDQVKQHQETIAKLKQELQYNKAVSFPFCFVFWLFCFNFMFFWLCFLNFHGNIDTLLVCETDIKFYSNCSTKYQGCRTLTIKKFK